MRPQPPQKRGEKSKQSKKDLHTWSCSPGCLCRPHLQLCPGWRGTRSCRKPPGSVSFLRALLLSLRSLQEADCLLTETRYLCRRLAYSAFCSIFCLPGFFPGMWGGPPPHRCDGPAPISLCYYKLYDPNHELLQLR